MNDMVLTFLVGAIIGSFLNVCIYRLPRKESIVFPVSHCPNCQTPIPFYHNIPILSFLLLRGKCVSCQKPIHWRYPLVELINAFGYIYIFSVFGMGWISATYALLFSTLLVVTFIDLEHKIIPDSITLPGMGLGLLAASTVLPPGFIDSLIGLLLGGGFFYLIAVVSRGGMGGGDIKLIAMIGAFLGWQNVLMTIFVGALAGSVVGIFLMIFRGKGRKYAVPFGPFLALGAVVSLLWNQEILNWYLLLLRS
ncbi:MAG TPA: prepilin peptidase [Nitrospiria bacterium]